MNLNGSVDQMDSRIIKNDRDLPTTWAASLLHGDLDSFVGGRGCQPLVSTQNSIKFWAASQVSINLWLPDSEDLRHFSVEERLGEPTFLGEAVDRSVP